MINGELIAKLMLHLCNMKLHPLDQFLLISMEGHEMKLCDAQMQLLTIELNNGQFTPNFTESRFRTGL